MSATLGDDMLSGNFLRKTYTNYSRTVFTFNPTRAGVRITRITSGRLHRHRPLRFKGCARLDPTPWSAPCAFPAHNVIWLHSQSASIRVTRTLAS